LARTISVVLFREAALSSAARRRCSIAEMMREADSIGVQGGNPPAL